MTGFLTGHCHLKGHLFKFGLVKQSWVWHMQAGGRNSLTFSLRLRGFGHIKIQHLGRHCMQPGDFEDISVSRISHFVQSAGLPDTRIHGAAQRIKCARSTSVTNMPELPVFYSIPRIFNKELHVIEQISCPRDSKYYFCTYTSYTIKLTWNSLRYLEWSRQVQVVKNWGRFTKTHLFFSCRSKVWRFQTDALEQCFISGLASLYSRDFLKCHIRKSMKELRESVFRFSRKY
jgi:hypothetical protein